MKVFRKQNFIHLIFLLYFAELLKLFELIVSVNEMCKTYCKGCKDSVAVSLKFTRCLRIGISKFILSHFKAILAVLAGYLRNFM